MNVIINVCNLKYNIILFINYWILELILEIEIFISIE
jgi:hypothetical protein